MTITIAHHRRLFAGALAAGLAFFTVPAAYAAGCADGNGHPPCPTHRDPGPSHAHAPYSASYHGPKTTSHTPSTPTTFTAAKKPTVGPVSPGPTHASANSSSTANKQGIIFVGGHSQSAGSKAALNPQPIPPGHPVSESMLAAHPQTAAPKPVPADPHSH